MEGEGWLTASCTEINKWQNEKITKPAFISSCSVRLKRYLSHTKVLVFYLAAKSNRFEIFVDNLRSKYFLSVQIKPGCTENTTKDLSWNWNTRQQIQPNLTKWYSDSERWLPSNHNCTHCGEFLWGKWVKFCFSKNLTLSKSPGPGVHQLLQKWNDNLFLIDLLRGPIRNDPASHSF